MKTLCFEMNTAVRGWYRIWKSALLRPWLLQLSLYENMNDIFYVHKYDAIF